MDYGLWTPSVPVRCSLRGVMSAVIGIIAGAGRFPFHVAEEAKRQGARVVAFGIDGWADPSLASSVDAYEPVAIGQLGRLIARLKFHKAQHAIMAGKVTKEVLFSERLAFDAEILDILSQARDMSVNGLLGAIGARLAREQITLLDSSTFLKANLCPVGQLTSRSPTPVEQDDMRLGMQIARQCAAWDVGQTVVVKRGVIVAVEALEGTDAAIARAHALAGDDLVVVKMASPSQDRRFDLPVIGPHTIETLTASRVSCLAVEAGTTLLLDRDALVAAANAARLCVMGVEPPAAADR